MKALVVLIACAVMVIATLVYIRRPHDREYVATLYGEDDDGVQPFDPRTAATGLAAG